MGAQRRCRFARLAQLLQGERAPGLEQPVARLVAALRRRRATCRPARPGDRARPIDRCGSSAADALRRLQREAADEDAEAAEHRLLVGRQQAVAPFERGAQRLVAAQRQARAAGQHAKALVEPRAQAVDAEQRHARRRQLDGQRDAVEPPADVDHAARLCVTEREARLRGASARFEERDGAGLAGRGRAAHRSAPPARRADRPARAWHRSGSWLVASSAQLGRGAQQRQRAPRRRRAGARSCRARAAAALLAPPAPATRAAASAPSVACRARRATVPRRASGSATDASSTSQIPSSKRAAQRVRRRPRPAGLADAAGADDRDQPVRLDQRTQGRQVCGRDRRAAAVRPADC